MYANCLPPCFGSSRKRTKRHPMPAVRLFALTICCFAIPTEALAAAWKHIAVSDDGLVNFYTDVESVAAKGSTRRVRLLFDFSKVQQDPDTLIEHRSIIEI